MFNRQALWIESEGGFRFIESVNTGRKTKNDFRCHHLHEVHISLYVIHIFYIDYHVVTMQKYLLQLLTDIETDSKNINFLFIEKELSIHDWISAEEAAMAPVRNLSEWTGIAPEMLPPASMLKKKEIETLLHSLKQMLAVYKCHFILQTEVPEDIQYETIRLNLNQNVKVKQWNLGFFDMCKRNTSPKSCALGNYCQCAFYIEFFAGQIEEHLTPEEERDRAFEIEVRNIKKSTVITG